MKKTLTANISGTVFHIEEDAYEALQRYLGNIRNRFTGTAGREDIMADIEARIAELFHERLDGRRQVVNMGDVDHVMAIMGTPDDFADGAGSGNADTGSATAAEAAMGSSTGRRRFFRDTDDKWLGGVFGGLGAYIGVDPLWLRIAAIVLVLASVGVLIPIYILLWILVPKADSAADRLQMRGEAVTVENIKRVVEEGAERFKQGGERMAREAGDLGRTWSENAGRRRSQALNVIIKLVGIALIVFAFSLLLGLVTGLIGGTASLWHATWSSEETGLLDLGELLFNTRDQAVWMALGGITLLVVPIIGLFLSGFRLLLDTRTPKWLGWGLTAIWLAAWIPVISTGLSLGKDFKRNNSTLTEIQLVQPASGTLYLDALDPADSTGNWSVHYDDGELEVDLDGIHLENGMVYGAWADLDVERSADSLFHLKVEREAHGATAKTALSRAEGIQYRFEQKDDALFVSPVIHFAAADKFRAQDAHFTLEVPLGRSIYLRTGSKHVIYDIDNVGNVYDRDMLGRTWTMTSRGLEDLNAPPVQDEDTPAPALPNDTIKAADPIAAVVWRAPAKRKATARPAQAATRMAAADADEDRAEATVTHKASLVPNVLELFLQRLF